MDGRQLVPHSQMKPGLLPFVREMLLRAFVAVPFIRFVTALQNKVKHKTTLSITIYFYGIATLFAAGSTGAATPGHRRLSLRCSKLPHLLHLR